jgi:hypothetical protein
MVSWFHADTRKIDLTVIAADETMVTSRTGVTASSL